MLRSDDDVPTADIAHRLGIPLASEPLVRRVEVPVGPGFISGIRWGDGEPRVVLLHGGGQNAHTWDAVAVALDTPLVALDLPGHGHSSWRDDRDYSPWANAPLIEAAIEELAPHAEVVVGMSLGGLTAIRLRSQRPDLVRRLVLVDVTPASGSRVQALAPRERGAVALIDQARTFPTFEAMYQATARAASGRNPELLRRGVLHNAKQQPDGSWTWRYDSLQAVTSNLESFTSLWADIAANDHPVILAVAARAGIVSPDDERMFFDTAPRGATVTRFDTADHSVQSAFPVELATLVRSQFGQPSRARQA